MDVGLPKQTALHCFILGFLELGGQLEVRHIGSTSGGSGALHVKWVYCSHSSSPNLCKNAAEILKMEGWMG